MKLESFSTILVDCTSKYNKIKKEDYLREGQFPIIDQGLKFIGGYTNNENLIIDIEKELIVFGDHTRTLKFIDFPIAIGADGVKVLHINKEKANVRYIYYFLKSIKITDAGYSRHFKFLKEIKIPILSLKSQIQIAEILAQTENLITQRNESITLLDELLKSTFLEMFGDPIKNKKEWKIEKIGKNCKVTKLAGYEYSKYIKYKEKGDIIAVKGMNVKNGRLKLDNSISYIDKSVSDFLVRSKLFEGDVVMTYIGINIGDVAIIEENEKYHLAPNVSKITPLSFDVINSYYLLHYLMYNRWLFVSGTTDTAKPALNMGEIREIKIIIPNIEIQLQFEKIAKKIELLKTYYKSSLIELENVYGALSQKAFKGELKIKKNHE